MSIDTHLVSDVIYYLALHEIEERVNAILESLGFPERKTCSEHDISILQLAEHLAWSENIEIPDHLLEEPLFANYYYTSLMDYEEFNNERREAEAERVRKQRVQAALEENDWDSLGYPTPECLVETLSSGESTRVDGYFLVFDEGYLWYTNPYGCDGVLSSNITVGVMRSFLKNIALGHDYGPVPPGC